MRTFRSSKEKQILKTLCAVRIAVSRDVLGVIVSRVDLDGIIVLSVPDVPFYSSVSLPANRARFQPRGLAYLSAGTVVRRAPCRSGGLCAWDD